MSRLRERRKALGMTQVQLAAAAELSQSTISLYELGESDVSGASLVGLARALQCSADYLIGLVDDPVPYHGPVGLSPLEEAVVSALRASEQLRAIQLIVGQGNERAE